MPTSASADHPRASRVCLGILLSGGLIAVALGAAAATAFAGDLLRGGYNANLSNTTNPGSFTPPSVAQERANAEDTLARATQAIDAVRLMQTNAQKIAATAGKSNLGLNETSPPTPPADPSRGMFVLGSSASLDGAGLLIDDRDGAPDADTLPEDTGGGTVSIASYSANLEAGSSIDVSGGVKLNASGKPSYGAGGSVSILAGNDPEITVVVGGQLELNAALSGYSGSKGGSLTVQAPRIQIGGATAAAGALLLAPDFFDQGGFGSFTLDALGADGKNGASLPAFTIAPGTVIDPVAESLVALPYAPGGAGLQVTTALLPVG